MILEERAKAGERGQAVEKLGELCSKGRLTLNGKLIHSSSRVRRVSFHHGSWRKIQKRA